MVVRFKPFATYFFSCESGSTLESLPVPSTFLNLLDRSIALNIIVVDWITRYWVK